MFATACIQPIDMVKVRIQLEGKRPPAGVASSPLSVARDVVSRGRFLDLYSGLSAAILRQAVYATARLGLFESFQNSLRRRAEGQGRCLSFSDRGMAALMAGGLAALIGNPADLALVRMQADNFVPENRRVRYRGVFDALRHIVKNEGGVALWQGAKPTVLRAMFMNLGQLAFFSESKAQLQQHIPQAPEVAQVLGASAVGAFFGAVFGLPFDFIKTRLQQGQELPSGSHYKGMIDCVRRVAREEGWLRFYRGFGTFYLRVGPQA